MSSATPARRRTLLSSRPPSSARSQNHARSETPPMPTYEPPEAPLTAEGHHQLASLLQSQYLRHLKTHLQHATEKLTDSAGEVNERLSDARVRYERSKEARRRNAGEDNQDGENHNNNDDEEDDDNDEYRQLGETELRVNATTARLEESMRRMVDSEVRLQGLTDAIGDLENEEGEAQAAALGQRQTRQQRRRRGRVEDEDDAEAADEDPQDRDYQGTPERETRERNAQNPPSRKLDGRLLEGVEKWDGLSLTERYSTHNSYIGFYRIVHDSKFPGDEVPPLPHSSTWFAHMEDPNAASRAASTTHGSSHQQNRRTRNRNREPSPADSDDIAIQRERISLKCPLTLLSYRDPVTSTKCPHSFEREAIHDMISRSSTTIPPPSGRGGRRIRVVKCPVCSIPLSADDLRPDPVLLRRVRRAEELEAREEEEDQLGDDENGGRRRKRADRRSGITLASDAPGDDDDDDAMDVDVDLEDESSRPRIKSERREIPIKDEQDTSRGSETEDEDE
ncbi:hypothetical protein NUU61_002990 [Penicillium alfredii]|uniref:SP-RING-type domain-containing protein n=1 Tax=Penicillium alfredii TaxID=1506179 RepID=A0A9W9KHG4_9EURO|nr:uncharacterized protein NUU61_002990 [Penicillium alfredii]KAJ5105643.1 hypothetical protein NUU61_002990 [Penicillium alfredii]